MDLTNSKIRPNLSKQLLEIRLHFTKIFEQLYKKFKTAEMVFWIGIISFHYSVAFLGNGDKF